MRISLVMIVYMLLLMVIPMVVGTYVYQDSRKRGMNPVLWTLLALLVPMLIGFVIYLLARVGYSGEICPRCQSMVKENYVVCPHCGIKLKPTCPNCEQPVEQTWKVCPYCAKALPTQQEDVVEPVRKKDKSLKVILGTIVAMPVILTALLVVYLVNGDVQGGMNTMYLDVDQYIAEMKDDRIEAWIRQCDEKAAQETELTAYVLRHDYKRKGERWSQFLVYLPKGDDNLRIEARRSATLFGKELQVHFLTDSSLEQGDRLCTVSCSIDKIARIETYRNAIKINCEVTKVDYGLTMFEIVPQD